MRRRNQAGDGRLSALVSLAALVAFGLAAWHVVPVFVAHYDFTDKVEEVCRTPRYKATDDELLQMLQNETRERRLDTWIGPDNFAIKSTDRGRQIKLNYEREVVILPGWKHNFKFAYTADQPLL